MVYNSGSSVILAYLKIDSRVLLSFRFEADYFHFLHPTYVRVTATQEIRIERGWSHTEADEGTTEMDLDDFNCWDLVVQNNSNNINDLKKHATQVLKYAKKKI
jgi:hypothetical protein